MAYVDDEASQQDGDPVELYEFTGGSDIFRYTSAEVDIDFDSGGGLQTFTAAPIKRSPVGVQDIAAREVTVEIPIDSALAARFIFAIAPSSLSLVIYRVHQTSGASSIYWKGPVASWTVKGRMVHLRVPDRVQLRLKNKLPVFKYQQHCNNTLYDEVCSIPAGLYQTLPTLSSISGDGRILTVSTMGAHPDGWADGGKITHQVTGVARMILSQVGTTLTIMWPFPVDVEVADDMIVNAGCDHSLATCKNKFSNVNNFTGTPFVNSQALNPTQGGD